MLEQLLRQYGYLVVYLGTLVEPDATLLASTLLSHRGYMNIALVWLFCVLASLTSSHVFFWLGRRRGAVFLERVAKSSKHYLRIRDWLDRHGTLLVLFSRFLWGTRIIICTASGATGFNRARFAALDAVGVVVWVTVIGTLGFAIAEFIARLFTQIHQHIDVIAIALVAAALVFDLWGRRKAMRSTPGE